MMGQIVAMNGDTETALAYLKESIGILERIGSPEAEKVKGIMVDVMLMGLMNSLGEDGIKKLSEAVNSLGEDEIKALLEKAGLSEP